MIAYIIENFTDVEGEVAHRVEIHCMYTSNGWRIRSGMVQRLPKLPSELRRYCLAKDLVAAFPNSFWVGQS